MHKEEKTAPLRPLAAFPSGCTCGEKTLETIPHHLQSILFSGLQNKWLKRSSAALRICSELEATVRYRHDFHSMGRRLQFVLKRTPQDGNLEEISRESPSLPVRGKGAVHGQNPSASKASQEGLAAQLLGLSLWSLPAHHLLPCLASRAAQQLSRGRCGSTQPRPVSQQPLTFTGWSDGTVVPFQVGGGDRVEGVEGQAVRAVHGAGQAVLKV